MTPIHLHIGQCLETQRGVWAVMLETVHLGQAKRRKWYGTLRQTTAEHLTVHAIQEGLNALRKDSQVIIHAPEITLTTCHQIQWGHPTQFQTPLKKLLPKVGPTLAWHDPWVYTTVDGLSSSALRLALTACHGAYYLAQIQPERLCPLLRLPSFFEGYTPLELTPAGFQLSRPDYRELLLQHHETRSAPPLFPAGNSAW